MKYNPTLHKLSNGVTVILDPMDIETTHVKICFNTGSRDELPSEYGITHFCEHMLCKGTPRFPTRKDLNNFIHSHGGTFNAFTSPEELCFHGRILGDNLDKLLDLLSDLLCNSLFMPERIELERIVILDELRRAQDNKGRKQTDFITRTLMNKSSYQTLGTEENIKSFTRDQLLGWLSKRLSAKNCTIVISGKIANSDAVLSQLESCFAFLPTHDVPENKTFNYRPAIAHHSSNETKNVNIFIAIPRRFDRSEQYKFESLCEQRFKKYLQDELFEEIRQKHGLVYGITVKSIGYEQGMHFIETECQPQHVAKVVELIASTCSNVYNKKPITDKWLKQYFSMCQLGDADWLDSWDKRSCDLLYTYRDTGKLYDRFGVIETVRGITAADVQKHTLGFFDVPISIVTDGPDFNADLGAIWKQNFPNSNISLTANDIISQIHSGKTSR